MGDQSRRTALAQMAAAASVATIGSVACSSSLGAGPTDGAQTQRMPVIYLPHGGGPWPWTPAFTPQLAQDYVQLRGYLESITESLPQRPTAVVIISAHWEARVPTVLSSPQPTMLYDYHGFPQNTYELEWSAPGSPTLASRVRQLLSDAGIANAENTERGYDHGTFVPMKLIVPEANIPTVQLSLDRAYNPAQHVAMGRALQPLRDEGVLIIGSGMSWEDFRAQDIIRRSTVFNEWFEDAAKADPATRNAALENWTSAPYAREAHPHEEHLLPMMVAAGAAGDDRGRIAWSGRLLGIKVSAVHFEAVG